MPRFRYRTLQASGAVLEGEVEAADQTAAVARLQAGGTFPIAVEAAQDGVARPAAPTRRGAGPKFLRDGVQFRLTRINLRPCRLQQFRRRHLLARDQLGQPGCIILLMMKNCRLRQSWFNLRLGRRVGIPNTHSENTNSAIGQI